MSLELLLLHYWLKTETSVGPGACLQLSAVPDTRGPVTQIMGAPGGDEVLTRSMKALVMRDPGALAASAPKTRLGTGVPLEMHRLARSGCAPNWTAWRARYPQAQLTPLPSDGVSML